eukprot:scaffold57992_cov20-Tisochrysis_lutea.AAC.1
MYTLLLGCSRAPCTCWFAAHWQSSLSVTGLVSMCRRASKAKQMSSQSKPTRMACIMRKMARGPPQGHPSLCLPIAVPTQTT